MDKRTEFKLRFKQFPEDYRMILRTIEPQTEEEIRNLIDIYSEILYDGGNNYSPLDILDYICDVKGWSWEDADWQEIIIKDWN